MQLVYRLPLFLVHYGPSWVLKISEKIAVQHVLSAKKLAKLRNRLKSDLFYSHVHLRKDFRKFFFHAKNILGAFTLVEDGALREDSGGDSGSGNEGASSWRKTRN